MKKLTIVLAAVLVLALLCGCTTADVPATQPEAEQPATQPEATQQSPTADDISVTTMTAVVLTTGERFLTVRPIEVSAKLSVEVELARGLVPVGADGWPISVSELATDQLLDVTYLGDSLPSAPARVIAVALRVVPEEDVPSDEPVIDTPSEPEVPVEPEREPFVTQELPAQDPVVADVAYDGLTLYGFPSIRTEIVRSGAADLDGDGVDETIQLLRIWDQYDQQSFILRLQSGEDIFDTCILEENIAYPVSFNAHIWLADLDEDGYPEVYFNGNMNSDRFVLNVWSMKNGTPELLAFEDQIFLEAMILTITDNSLQLESTQDVLGSYTAVRAYTLQSGAFQPLGDAWQIVPENTSYSRMTLVRELPVTLADGTDGVFEPGTVLQVTGTDGESFVDVITEDGTTGRIAVEQPAGDWQWYIDGEPELSFFTLVPYA